MTEQRYRVLCADPPWPFDDQLNDFSRGAATQYNVLSIEDIKRFPLPPMYEDSTLFLWRVSAMQQEALDVCAAWDFEVKAEIIWKKLTKHGKRHMGMGRHVRMEHETCLIATSGKPKTLDKSIRSIFEAPVGRHSEKPELFYTIVRQLREGPYVELFARRERAGWTCLGNQVKCSTCGEVIREVTCEKHPQWKQQACRCCHAGDLICRICYPGSIF